MKRVSFLVGGLGLFLAGTLASAAPVVNVGTVVGPLAGTVSFQLLVSDLGDIAAEDIEAMTLSLQIRGGGTGTLPTIQPIDILTGTIWSGHASTSLVPDGTNPQLASVVVFNDAVGDFVNANGVLATVVIDTTGAAPGEYSLNLTGIIPGPGSDTDFQNAEFQSVSSVLTNGILTVPEPSALSLLALAGLATLRHRRYTTSRF